MRTGRSQMRPWGILVVLLVGVVGGKMRGMKKLGGDRKGWTRRVGNGLL
jgi:hypothetical protein